jgi:hypothetical protein
LSIMQGAIHKHRFHYVSEEWIEDVFMSCHAKCLTPFLVHGKGDGMFDQLRELLSLTIPCCLQCPLH